MRQEAVQPIGPQGAVAAALAHVVDGEERVLPAEQGGQVGRTSDGLELVIGNFRRGGFLAELRQFGGEVGDLLLQSLDFGVHDG